jgi:hypothetical protein
MKYVNKQPFKQFLYTLLLLLFQIHDTSKKYKTTY